MTTKPTNFHLLENLTIHSYRAKIIAMLKPWVYQQNKQLQLHNIEILSKWLGRLSFCRWIEAMEWLDTQMKSQRTNVSLLNNYWNNHLWFCILVKAYLTLSYSIKMGNVSFSKMAMQKVAIILQAFSAKKPKYAREMLCQMHILDTKAAYLLLQKAYITNALVNLRGLPFTFYKINLLLEHQNREFKRFWADKGSSLQETNEMFQLHALSVNALSKTRRVINRFIIKRKRNRRHLTKNSTFDI